MRKFQELNLSSTYTNLHNRMYSIVEPYDNTGSTIELLNIDLIEELSLEEDFLQSKEGTLLLSGSTNKYGPLFAQAYSGHQFGYFTTLGDGRAVVIGEIKVDNQTFDIQLKGTGRTKYSRNGDGLGSIKSMLREYLISESLHYLNIPTSRSLAVLKTNKLIQREVPLKGGILARVLPSHIRIGTVEYAKAIGGSNQVKELLDYMIDREFQNIKNETNKYQLLLREVIDRQALLIAKWQSVGFVHGVLNTDNVLLNGYSIDFGPCAFLDVYKPDMVFSSIDRNKRYAYNNQPYITSFNLSKLAEAMVELLADDVIVAIDIANQELREFEAKYKTYYMLEMSKKFGIDSLTEEEYDVVFDFLKLMEQYQEDYTNTFVSLTTNQFEDIRFYQTKEWNEWFIKWTRALGYRKDSLTSRINRMKQSNPTIIPRNEVLEQALKEATLLEDYSLYNELLEKIKNPFDYQVNHKTRFTTSSNRPFTTYCGT